MHSILLLITAVTGAFKDYITGAVIALLILAYLLFSLVKPEKF